MGIEKVQQRKTRRERFESVMEMRKKRAIESIKSLENISNKSNYYYEKDEIVIIYRDLLSAIVEVIALFNKGTPEERLRLYMQADEMQLEYLEDKDPEVARLFKTELPMNPYFEQRESRPVVSDDIKNLTHRLERLERMQEGISTIRKDYNLSLNKEITKINTDYKVIKDKLRKLDRFFVNEGLNGKSYILDPKYDMSSMSDHPKNDIDKERLKWIANGRTFEDIIDSESPYSTAPGFQDPRECLQADIRRGRVIEIS